MNSIQQHTFEWLNIRVDSDLASRYKSIIHARDARDFWAWGWLRRILGMRQYSDTGPAKLRNAWTWRGAPEKG
jgi:hypothetical protein